MDDPATKLLPPFPRYNQAQQQAVHAFLDCLKQHQFNDTHTEYCWSDALSWQGSTIVAVFNNEHYPLIVHDHPALKTRRYYLPLIHRNRMLLKRWKGFSLLGHLMKYKRGVWQVVFFLAE